MQSGPHRPALHCSSVMEHDQLIGEMLQIERLTTAERLRLARFIAGENRDYLNF